MSIGQLGSSVTVGQQFIVQDSNLIAIHTGDVANDKPSLTIGILPDPATLALIAQAGGDVTIKSLAERGVHDVGSGRVMGVQFKVPEDHPAQQAIENAFYTDCELGNPESALRQYERALEDRNRLQGGVISNHLVEMIGRSRMGIAHNHLVAKAKANHQPFREHADNARKRLNEAIALGEAQGVSYGAAYYNLATLEAHLGNVDAGIVALQKCIEVDPSLFKSLADKDIDLAPLWGGEFGTVIPRGDDSVRPEPHAYPAGEPIQPRE